MLPKKFYYLLHPRPVYVIGSGSFNNNEINFMAASWVMPVAEDIPSICLACDKEQYTYQLIEKYKQFSVNLIDDINLIWKLGTTSGKEINKVKEFNLKVIRGKILDVPILENSLAFLEAKVINKIDVVEVALYIAEVVNYDGKNLDEYGLKEFWKIPLHKGGKAFVFIDKKLYFV
ncbi:MAG: flavin reductase family protein [Candidatus Aenigmatarchaeota archaeon]